MTGADVSVIVPVYNGASYVREAIASVLGQQQPPREILVVDDGSADATPAVVAVFGERVISIRQENRGPAAARNAGIAYAAAPLIAFVDADDLWTPRSLADQLACFKLTPDAEVIWGLTERVFMPGAQSSGDDWHDRPQWALAVGSMLFKRKLLDDVGGFDETLRVGEDMDLLARLTERETVIIRNDAIVHLRRIHGANLTADGDAMIQAHYRVVSKAMDRRRARAHTAKDSGE